MPRFSNWREDIWLSEVVTGKMTDKEALKKVDEKKGIHNKVIINPKLTEAIKEIGGEVIDIVEADTEKQHQIIQKKQMILDRKKLRLRRKDLQQAQQEKNAGQKPEETTTTKQADVIATEEVGVSSSARMKEAQKEAELKAKEEAAIKKAKKVKEEFEDVVEYFYEEGINEEGIDLLVEEIGLEEFVDFVDGGAVELNEERAARKMNVRTLKATKKKAEEIKSDKSDVVKKGTPADTLARARTERAFKKRKLAKPTPKSKKDYDGDGKKETPKQEHRGVRNKKITKAVAKVKPAQPKKPASKEGIRAKVKAVYDAGVKRHRKATQPIRVFHKGMKKAPKAVAKAAVDVKRAVVGEGALADRLKANLADKKKKWDKQGDEHKKMVKDSGEMVKQHKKELDKIDEEKKSLPKLKMYRKAGNLARKGDPESMKKQTKIVSVLNKETEKGYKKAALDKLRSGGSPKHQVDEKFATQYKDKGKLSKTDAPGSRHDHTHDVDPRMADHVPNKKVRKSSKAETRANVLKFDMREAKVDTGDDVKKETDRNKRRFGRDAAPRGSGGVEYAQTLVRRREHRAKRGVKEDKAFDNVVSMLRKKHGKDAVLTKDSPKPKAQPQPKAKPQKPLTAKEKAHKEVIARYGGEANYKAGRGLGT